MSKLAEWKDGMDDLGRRLAEGSDEAFTEVVGQYSKRVYALCYRMLRNEEEARDMAQEVFVKV
ncbi:MAG TPA: sigma factor, partial [bacterium]|nr:sigma factor [bacterium]